MECVRKKDVFTVTVNGTSKKFPIIKMPRTFVEWNLGQRLGFLEHMIDPAVGAPGRRSFGFGAHLPVYVTNNRPTSLFPANAAVKGSGFVAKEKYIDYYIEKFRRIIADTNLEEGSSETAIAEARKIRMETIIEFYSNPQKIDFRCMAGLEIWPGATSKNFKADPRVSVHFLGMPGHQKPARYQQWQINCIWEEIKNDDPRFVFGRTLRELTLGKIGRSFVPGHIPIENTPVRGKYPSGWILWAIEVRDKGLNMAGV